MPLLHIFQECSFNPLYVTAKSNLIPMSTTLHIKHSEDKLQRRERQIKMKYDKRFKLIKFQMSGNM